MKNQFFAVEFDKETGAIASIVCPRDVYQMNWCNPSKEGWGLIRSENCYFKDPQFMYEKPHLISFREDEAGATSVYTNGRLEVTVERFFRNEEKLVERFTIKNIRSDDAFLDEDEFGITLPLNDRYTNAEECMTSHCNSHIWCGGSTSYVNALRMGKSNINLGLVLTEGALESYSQDYCVSNIRGVFILNSAFFHLGGGQSHTIEWELFWHEGADDFMRRLAEYPHTIHITAPNYTVFEGETVELSAESLLDLSSARLLCNGERIDFTYEGNALRASYKPQQVGEYVFTVEAETQSTRAEFICVKPLGETIDKRLEFIADNQQFKGEGPLHGAFLLYDNKNRHIYCDSTLGDRNACRERIGMALLMAKYLQTHENSKLMKSLELYMEFLKREFYDSETGHVFNNICRDTWAYRLYNAPWVMQLFAEMYFLTGDTSYTDDIVKAARCFYRDGGGRFYPNAVTPTLLVRALRESKNPDAEEIVQLLMGHAENIIKVGTAYPKHEVNYEQTIVTPAVQIVADMGEITGDPRYVAEAGKHMENLERFDGAQPSYHLCQIPIRFWDGFWFGKAHMMGDTMPHYWSCLSALAYFQYAKISGKSEYHDKARMCMRNCLCLFNEKGEGSCAYMYPHKLDGKAGEFYDAWANDQDFALYFAMYILG